MGRELLNVKHVSKYFSGVRALDDVSFDVMEGEILAICGENGAGKSTLIKVLSGAHEPTAGSVIFDGKEYDRLTPALSKEIGIRVIYQEFSLIPYLTIAENLFLGQEIEQSNRIFTDKKEMEKRTQALFDEFGVQFDPGIRVRDLGVAEQQIVEIMKGISERAKLYIMDEPTASLTLKETDIFFNIITKLKADGSTIIFISHRLEEVFELCDRVAVFMDGKHVITREVSEINRQQLIKYMIGRDLNNDYPVPELPSDDVVLKVEHLQWGKRVKDVSFELHRGEILGLGGLVGAGRTEAALAIYGATIPHGGSITLKGKPYTPKSPEFGLRNGIGLIPEDRKKMGLLLKLSVKDNICISVYNKLKTKLHMISVRKENELCDEYIKNLRIKTPTKLQLIKNLSGGNQQKAIMAKVLSSECDILIFDEPTRGIDIGAKQEIYQIMCRLASEGKSIIMISSEMPELIGMSNRVVVMSGGYSVGELSKQEMTQETILTMAASRV